MSRKSENSAFRCVHCGREILPVTNGSYRNHCPFCLYSVHVDFMPGDRSSHCLGVMKPIGVVYHSKKGWQIIHLCEKCGVKRVNRIAENTVMPDDFSLVIRFSQIANEKNR